jgi:hypothetical protein
MPAQVFVDLAVVVPMSIILPHIGTGPIMVMPISVYLAKK